MLPFASFLQKVTLVLIARACSWLIRRSFKGYEEVRVPAVKSGALAADEKLVKIEEMEDWAQPAFQGYK